MRVLSEYGNESIAKVYVAEMRENSERPGRHLVEFVESVQPPLTRDDKWVLIVSSMFGCPIKCLMCDAGGDYAGKLTADELLAQVDYLVRKRYGSRRVPVPKFKIQFARMGEPSMNPAVLEALERLPTEFDAPGLNASLSTVAPKTPAVKAFFNRLLEVKDERYSAGRFQLQFSIHTTDKAKRDALIPTAKWPFEDIARYGARFSHPESGDKKVTLNFAPAVGYPIDAAVIRSHFDPERFIIKLTPLNPTVRGHERELESSIKPEDAQTSSMIIDSFKEQGFDVVLSIGELEENRIGSNCGQFIQRALNATKRPERSYALETYGSERRT